MTKQRHGQGRYLISMLLETKKLFFFLFRKAKWQAMPPRPHSAVRVRIGQQTKNEDCRGESHPRTLHVCFAFKHPLHDGFAIHGVISYDL